MHCSLINLGTTAIGIQVSGPSANVGVNPVGAFEGIYNTHTGEITVFGVLGVEGNVGAKPEVFVGQVVWVYGIGSDNLPYLGKVISVSGGAAYIVGVTGAFSYVPKDGGILREPDSPFSVSVGGSGSSIGAVITGATLEYIPLFTLKPGKPFEPLAGWAIFENDDRGPIGGAVEFMMTTFFERYGIDPHNYDWHGPGE